MNLLPQNQQQAWEMQVVNSVKVSIAAVIYLEYWQANETQ
jgi:hypothetical protein